MSPPDAPLAPLPRLDGEPVFDDVWQAQVLAMAHGLVETGVISADTWSNTLGAALKTHQTDAESDTIENYYLAALEALETVLQSDCDISKGLMQRCKSDWMQAYETTPHGKPVELFDTCPSF